MRDFSLQLFSLRNIPTLQERLEIASKAGYTGVEFAGYGDIPAYKMKNLLKELGLRGVGTHIGYDLLKNNLEDCVRYCVEAGITTATCPGYGMDNSSREDIRELTNFLEKCAARFAREGIPFAYHNHSAEFRLMDGKPILHWMLKDSENLTLELDVYWAACAGVDPLTFAKEYAGRISLFHFKEMSSDGKNVELGTGIVNFHSVLAYARENDVKEIIVEQEDFNAFPPEQAVAIDAEYMKAL